MANTTTTKKKTTTKKSTNSSTKKTAPKTTEVVETPVIETPVIETKKETPKKQYAPSDMIMCHSVFPGKFLFSGPKTHVTYPFSAPGDETPVEYQDLQSAMMAKKKSIMAPFIIIDDEDILEDPRWKQVKNVYDKMFVIEDMDEFLAKPREEFRKEFELLPVGAKKSVMMAIASKVRDGEFSEMHKIRIVDEACNSNIAVLLSR